MNFEQLSSAPVSPYLLLLPEDQVTNQLLLANQPAFESLISTLEHFVKDPNGLSDAKLAFAVLTRMCLAWGGPSLDPEDANAVPQPELPGFDQFMIERFSPLCWALPSNPAFDPKDGQAKQVLAEAAHLQMAICSRTGHQHVSWLREVELRGMGMDEATVDEYVQAVGSSDLKGFRQYFQV